jgi:tetratricopeptide (TPR) repeat protein
MKLVTCLAWLLISLCGVALSQRPRPTAKSTNARTVTINSEPKAIVWIDEIRRGVTNDSGTLSSLKLSAGAHNLRVRATGFKEMSIPITAIQRGEIKVRLVRTTDQAELLFQRAENARETARDDPARQAAADLYFQALKLKPKSPAAHLGLARVLSDLNDPNSALSEIEAARSARPVYAEASAVEGRIYRETGQTDEAFGAFNRAIREAHGMQPEAHVGIGLVYEGKGQYELAAREFKIATDQLFDTEPIIYQLLGAAYEKSGNNAGAIAAYENYLRLAPSGAQASAVKSIVEQLKSQPPQ